MTSHANTQKSNTQQTQIRKPPEIKPQPKPPEIKSSNKMRAAQLNNNNRGFSILR